MHRTSILISGDLRREAEAVAKRRGITLSELIRRQLALAVRRGSKPGRGADPLFKPRRLARRTHPSDLAANHDAYLYGPVGGESAK